MRYRRATTRGGTYFFTVNLADRSSTLLVDGIDALRDAMRTVQQRHPFHIDAIVVLPDHLHAIWTLPENDAGYPQRWALIKAGFSRQLPGTEQRSASRQRKGERGIWQRRYWEHQIKDDNDFTRHVDYIHINPVKHGYAERPIDWPHSSIHRYVKDRILPSDWAANPPMEGRFGEA
ncbi:MAG TPA: transposase [Noviherbaspirillum sp.]|nr:transposase [Noviherbaspirillum sp.]